MEIDQLTQNTDKIGSIAIIGSGIAGIQTALDIANSGFKVHLIEERPNVGGVMAQLDKTFPTNDCAMCIVSPKLVSVGRHPDIEILTNTTVEALTGSAGRFKVKMHRAPRYVDMSKCTGCGDCEKVCETTVPDPHNLGLCTAKAIRLPHLNAWPKRFVFDREAVGDAEAKKIADACAYGAIDFEATATTETIDLPLGEEDAALDLDALVEHLEQQHLPHAAIIDSGTGPSDSWRPQRS